MLLAALTALGRPLMDMYLPSLRRLRAQEHEAAT
jgi:hypothetical protein